MRKQSLALKGLMAVYGVVAITACSHAADHGRTGQGASDQQAPSLEGAGQGTVIEAPGVLRSWYQPPPEDQHPYVPPPRKRYIPLGGDSTGPVIVLPGGNGPQSD
ncbi:hypothetical protein PsW64_05183 [Pseudovibrio sp. W64]|uniref:hypothetical protein n=1 Tax=Pseudovibrio sp. W64 TaxID=1735583 RepID=UPI0007B26B18|nr:hypothetical protein [Pseudovibrio sp. W64]KZK76454.1 hypothetical protein PsW64_05183 [Pseudovibrio sp. W64]